MGAIKRIAFDLKSDRVARRLTQVQVAEICMTTQKTVSCWEKSGNMPRANRALWENWKKAQGV